MGGNKARGAGAELRLWSIAGIAVGILLAAAGGLDSLLSLRQASESAHWVSFTEKSDAALEHTLAHMVDIEAGSRGFAATGDSTFLAPVQAGRRGITADLDQLESLTVHDSLQHERLELLKRQISERLQTAGDTVDERLQTGKVPSRPLFLLGKQRMDAVRATIAEMQSQGHAALNQHIVDAELARRRALRVTWTTTVTGIAILLFAGFIMRREITRNWAMQAQVESLNAELEHRAQERTLQLNESRQRLQGIIESAMDAIITVDEQQRIVMFNPAAEKMFQQSREAVMGRPLSQLIPERFHGRHADHIAHFGDTNQSRRMTGNLGQLWGLRADSSEFPIEASISRIEVSGRRLFTAIVRDETDRMAAEEALLKSHTRMRFALETAKLGDWEVDLPTRRAIGSLLHAQIFGYPLPPQDWTFEKFVEHVHPEDRPGVLAHFDRCAVEGKRSEVECRIYRTDGELRWIWSCADVYRDSQGSARMFGIVKDITDAKQAEEALRQSEERFQAMVNGIPQLAWMADPDGHILWYNQRWYDYTGTNFEQMEGWGWQSVHEPDFLPKVLEGWRAALRDGGRFEMEFPLRRADGTFHMFLTRVMPLKDSTGRVVRWFGTSTDISERKLNEEQLALQAEELSRQADELRRSQAALQAQTRTLKLVLDSIDQGLIAADEQGHFQIWNPAAEKILGRGPSAIGPEQWSPFYNLFEPDGETQFASERLPLVRAIKGEAADEEFIVRNPQTNEELWIDVSARPIRDESGQVKGGVAAFHDVTERKKAQEALAENSRLLDLTQVMVRDMDSRIVLWSSGAEKLYGYTRREALGKSPHELFRTIFPEPVESIEKQLLETGHWDGELVHHKRDGTALVVASVCVLHRDAKGRPCRILEANIDVTSMKAAEREIRKLNNELELRVQKRTAQLEAANKELEAFTYSVSHDLRAPLRHISGFSQILKEEYGTTLPPEAQQYVQKIQDGTRRMGHLVDDLLNLGRVGRQEVRLQVTGLTSIVREVISELQRDCEGRQVEWKIGDLPFVDCDPGLVRQVFHNLLANSVKFTRPRNPAVIEVGQSGEDRARAIFVRDNGVGFSMKYSNKLFGVFQRLHRAEDFEGTGVGLATIQRIINKHGGRIWAEAELDRGATFYFTLANSESGNVSTKSISAGGTS
ncbi:MAG TPA: PAS domain S-box protein [Candidatus Solibacter sp.]|nr:PAS domain S-box protein [Candidatus Solibacter sp.]